MTTISKIIAFIIVFGIALVVARSGKNKLIGFYWSIYFTLLMPVLGIIMTLTSGKQDGKVRKENIVFKIIAIMCFIYGSFLLLQAVTLTENNATIVQSENVFERRDREIGDIQTGNNKSDEYVNDQITRLAAVIGSGVLSLTVDVSELKAKSIKSKRLTKFNATLIVLSIGVFLLRLKRSKPILVEKKEVTN